MLAPYRRHLDTCPHRHLGRVYTKCSCPLHVDGVVNGSRIRAALNTVNWARAMRRTAEIEEEAIGGKARKPIADAVGAFLAGREGEPETIRKRLRVMKFFSDFAGQHDIATIDRFRLEDLDSYRATRKLTPLSWSKELQTLRTLFEFCRKRKWCEENVAKDMEMPPDPKPRPRAPYTTAELAKIRGACDTFGKSEYERRRATAMILLMRFYGLRISDVATLSRERISKGQIFLHALKNGAPIWLPLYPEVAFALEAVPAPHGASADCPYYFWNGTGITRNHIDDVAATLRAVFRKSGVEGATPHRFRHTLTTEILVKGGTIEDAANILGDSPAIIRKHYAKWSADYQHRTIEVFSRIHGTSMAHDKNTPVSAVDTAFMLVPGVGLEKTKRKKPC